jgi:hypothetical protein
MLTNEMLATINEDRDLNDNIIALRELGGPAGLTEKLQTNLKTGLMRNANELEKIRERFGRNEVVLAPSSLLTLCHSLSIAVSP